MAGIAEDLVRMQYLWAIVGALVFAAIVVIVTSIQRNGVGGSGSVPPAVQSEPEVMGANAPIESDTYVIREGDTLASIAGRRWGDARMWRRIVEANPGLGTESIKMGDEISLPDLETFREADALIAELDESREARPSAVDERTLIEVPEGEPLLLGLDDEIKFAEVLPGNLVRDVDGSIVADGAFRLEGKGTREAPYRVSWELLASAADDYRPTLNKRGIPQRVAILNNAWVEIEGYVAFPLPQDTSEMIVMLNQWDGCCIGIPPTPYDAVEVKLNEPVAPGRRHALRYGTVTGLLIVEPYLIENWLVGLYLMDDASVRLEL
ncbi:MAG: LysM peptidoglycan-binding domain-containing protein [Phycisphaerales bacterium]|nr:LysM peptidoglycan-binding domain-containing protein [Phycisphaerales bacterium]